MNTSMCLRHVGIGKVECGEVGQHYWIDICEGGAYPNDGITIQATREQLEQISATLNTYLRSLDPPEAPLPDRDPTAPLEAAPGNPTAHPTTVTREQYDRATARLARKSGGISPRDDIDRRLCDTYERENPGSNYVLRIEEDMSGDEDPRVSSRHDITNSHNRQ